MIFRIERIKLTLCLCQLRCWFGWYVLLLIIWLFTTTYYIHDWGYFKPWKGVYFICNWYFEFLLNLSLELLYCSLIFYLVTKLILFMLIIMLIMFILILLRFIQLMLILEIIFSSQSCTQLFAGKLLHLSWIITWSLMSTVQ